jgi:transposase
MKQLKTVPHLSDNELLQHLSAQKDLRAFRDWQIITAIQTHIGKKAKELASVLGVSISQVYHVIQQYNPLSSSWRTTRKRGGRREARSLMSLEEESEILKRIEKQALAGQILISKQVKGFIEEKLGKSIPDDSVWDLFKRHTWTRKVPRQSHPQADKEAQEVYTKHSRNYRHPNH